MIAILKHGTTPEQTQHLVKWLEHLNIGVHISEGEEVTVLGLIGDTSRIDMDLLSSLDIVETVKRVSEPFKQVNRKFHPLDTVIEIGDAKIGGGHFAMIAGPCSVESEEQIIGVAMAVKQAGANILRGGAFKPRTSPYAFQGMKDEGIKLLLKAKEATGLPIVTEIMNISTLDLFADVDVIQVGARNMQNFDLLKELGKTNKPILLKRGLANTLQELLMSAEYILSEGMKTSSSVSAASVPSRLSPVTLWICRQSLLFTSLATCRWWSIPATQQARQSLFPPWHSPQQPLAQTASWWRYTTIPRAPCATVPNP